MSGNLFKNYLLLVMQKDGLILNLNLRNTYIRLRKSESVTWKLTNTCRIANKTIFSSIFNKLKFHNQEWKTTIITELKDYILILSHFKLF